MKTKTRLTRGFGLTPYTQVEKKMLIHSRLVTDFRPKDRHETVLILIFLKRPTHNGITPT